MTEQTHIVVYIMKLGPPLIVGPFADHDRAVGFLFGENVAEELHDGGWVQTPTPPASYAFYSPVEPPGQCDCNG
jgi:hypothetical protein